MYQTLALLAIFVLIYSSIGGGVERTRDVELIPLADVAPFDGGESLSLPALSEVGLGVDAPARIVEDASLTLDVPSELAAVPRAYRQRSEEFREEFDCGESRPFSHANWFYSYHRAIHRPP